MIEKIILKKIKNKIKCEKMRDLASGIFVEEEVIVENGSVFINKNGVRVGIIDDEYIYLNKEKDRLRGVKFKKAYEKEILGLKWYHKKNFNGFEILVAEKYKR